MRRIGLFVLLALVARVMPAAGISIIPSLLEGPAGAVFNLSFQIENDEAGYIVPTGGNLFLEYTWPTEIGVFEQFGPVWHVVVPGEIWTGDFGTFTIGPGMPVGASDTAGIEIWYDLYTTNPDSANFDPDDPGNQYGLSAGFSTSISVTGDTTVPEPGSAAAVAGGLIGLWWVARRRKRAGALTGAVLALAAAAGTAGAQAPPHVRYEISPVPVPADAVRVWATRLTDAGQVVGSYLTADGKTKGFYYDGSNLVPVTPPQPEPGSWVITDVTPAGGLIGYRGERGELAQPPAYGGLWWLSPSERPDDLSPYRLLRIGANGTVFADRRIGSENTVFWLGGPWPDAEVFDSRAPGWVSDVNNTNGVVFSSPNREPIFWSWYPNYVTQHLQMPERTPRINEAEKFGCVPLGINDSETIVGTCAVRWDPPAGLMDVPVIWHPWGPLEVQGEPGYMRSINNSGQMVGANVWCEMDSCYSRPVLVDGGYTYYPGQLLETALSVDLREWDIWINNPGHILLRSTDTGFVILKPRTTAHIAIRSMNAYGIQFEVTGGPECNPGTWPTHTFDWPVGATCTVTAPATAIDGDSRFQFQEWAWSTDDGSTWGNSSSRTFSISVVTDAAYAAAYARLFRVTVNIDPPNSGTVNGAGWQGVPQVLQAIAAPGYVFDYFTLPGGITSADNPLTLYNAFGDYTVTAHFRQIHTTMAARIAGKGTTLPVKTWTFALLNYGPDAVDDARITGVQFSQTAGTACTPTVVSPLSIPVGLLGPGMSAPVPADIDFTGCDKTSRFNARISFSAAGGTYRSSTTIMGQFR
jgi:hypothetical protein